MLKIIKKLNLAVAKYFNSSISQYYDVSKHTILKDIFIYEVKKEISNEGNIRLLFIGLKNKKSDLN
jgi:hypothetical protein